MRFSQRIGKTPLIKEIQIESIDEDLKNGLWNVYSLFILSSIEGQSSYESTNSRTSFSNILWHNYFKQPIDKIPSHFSKVTQSIREYYFRCKWYEIYDLIEFSIRIIDNDDFNIDIKQLIENFNDVLERECAGYRFIEETLSPITNLTEIEEVEEAISFTDNFTSLKGCNFHLKDALSKLSNRLNPDYRNSIKESVSAIESLAKIISNNSKDSLGASLDKIKGKIKIHSALERGFKQIYGYTSDSDGIRHGLMEEPTCDFEDAKFMLVSCSAFINYLVAKAIKSDIKLS